MLPWLGGRLAQRIKNLTSKQMMEEKLTETSCFRLSECRARLNIFPHGVKHLVDPLTYMLV